MMMMAVMWFSMRAALNPDLFLSHRLSSGISLMVGNDHQGMMTMIMNMSEDHDDDELDSELIVIITTQFQPNLI